MSNIQKLIDMANKQAAERAKAKAEAPSINIAKSLAALSNEKIDNTKEAFVRKYHIKDILKYKKPEELVIDVHKALNGLNNSLSVQERNMLLMKFLREWRDANVVK